eukprot:EG_transcript_17539
MEAPPNLTLEADRPVVVHVPSLPAFHGTVVAVHANGELDVRSSTGAVQRVQRWRATPAPFVEAGDGVFDGHFCSSCDTVVPAAACLVNSLWAQYTQFQLPFRCPYCAIPLDVEVMPGVLRALQFAWPPRDAQGAPITTLLFGQFVHNVQERQKADADSQARHVEERLQLLRDSPCGSIAQNFCEIPNAPLRRACPRCGIIIEYESECKHMTCARCKHKFCFACLRDKAGHNDATYKWSIGFACPVAPIQTRIPDYTPAAGRATGT